MGTINIISYYFYVAVTYVWFAVSYIYDQFRGFSFIIKLAAISATLFIILSIYLVLRITRRAAKRSRRRKLMKRLDKHYGDGIRYILSPESPNNMTRDDIIKALDLEDHHTTNYAGLLKKSRDKMSFCRLVYQERLSENAGIGKTRNINTMLTLFDLPQYLESVVNRGSSDKQVEAMLMMYVFKLPINQWIANRMIGSKRSRVIRLASYASIMSNSNNDLEYFDSDFFDNNCCIYDEIQLGYMMQRRLSMRRTVPNMAHWAIMHKNPDAQCIFIRMMRMFDQKEYCSELDVLYQHNANSNVIEEISRTWGYLGYTAADDIMRDMMFTQNDDIKVTIMHALARLNTGNSLYAIEDIYLHNRSQYVRYEALRSIYNYGDEGRAKFEELRLKADETDRKLFEFFDNKMSTNDVELPKDALYEQMSDTNILSVL